MSWRDTYYIELVGGYFDGLQERSKDLPNFWQKSGPQNELITFKRTADQTPQGAWKYVLEDVTFPPKHSYKGAFD